MKNFYNFVIKFWELCKSDSITSIAKYLIGTGVLLVAGIGIFNLTYKEISLQYSDEGNIIGYLFLVSGFIIAIYRTFTKKNTITLVYGKGLENMNNHTPMEAIPKYLHFDCISLDIKEINSYHKNEIIDDYSFNRRLLENRIQNKNSKKIYVGALGSFPYLFLLGCLFRNAYSEVITLDFDRHKSKWYKLPHFSEEKESINHKLMYEDISIDTKINNLNSLAYDEVGIALSYTFQVNKDAIPNHLQNHTLYLKNSYGIGHDKLSNEESQKELLKELSVYMATLWNSHKKIHLFVSSQSSICINIGKSYMNNAHGILVLYNYNNPLRTYNWSIEFDKGNIPIRNQNQNFRVR